MNRISDADLERHIASTHFQLPWKAVPLRDRLHKWCVVADGSAGTGKPLVADGIRTEGHAEALAAAPDAFAELKALRELASRAVYFLSHPQAHSLADLTTIVDDAIKLGLPEASRPGM